MASDHLRVVGTAPATLVDSCVLLDVILEDPTWMDWSARALEEASDSGPLMINPIIYAEVSVAYATVEEIDHVLPPDAYLRDPLPYRAGFLAGKAFRRYRKAGGEKRSPLSDFYIGAHAAASRYQLLTRDAKRYRTYFPKLTLISPSG